MNISVLPLSDTDFGTAKRQLTFQGADEDFMSSLEKKQDMYCIWHGDALAGLAQVEASKSAYLYLFLHTPYRRMGIGHAALELCERILRTAESKTIVTAYRTEDDRAKSFAQGHGYVRQFNSTYMKYTGPRFALPPLPIRGYEDEDYVQAHGMYARAFHEMRMRVGDFPDSVIEKPTDAMRQHWASTKAERLVYVEGGDIIAYAHVVGNEVGSISVRPECQGRSIGRLFMQFIIDKVLDEGHKGITLYCVVGNRARRLYDHLGFMPVYTNEYAKKTLREDG